MDRVLPSTLEMALLYEDFARYEPRELVALINQVCAPYSRKFSWVTSDNTEQVLQFTADEFGVEVIHAEFPLDHDMFQRALASGYTERTFPDAGRMVASHRKHVYITVGLLADPGSEPGGLAFDEEQFGFALQLVKMLGIMYLSRSRPLAVHWLQSDKLLTARDFAEIGLEKNNTGLLVHPCVSGCGVREEDGAQLNTLRTIGAATLIGREIVFQETPVEAGQLAERAVQFIHKVRETGLMIPDGDTFGNDESESIRVRYKDDELCPSGIFELTYELSKQHGINLITSSEEDAEDQAEAIDEEDPVEKALREKIAELKAREGNNLFNVGLGGDEEEADAAPQKVIEPWQGISRRADLKALRDLVRSSDKTPMRDTAMVVPNAADGQNGVQEIEAPALETPSSVPVADVAVAEDTAAEGTGGKKAGLMRKFAGVFSKRQA